MGKKEAYQKVLKVLGTKAQNDDPTSLELVKVRALCARASTDFENLKKDNEKLVKENVKLTKRKDKFLCKIKDANKEIEQMTKLFEEVLLNKAKGSLSKKLYKQIAKTLGFLKR